MGWPEAVVEIMRILQKMPRWMAGMVLLIALVLAVGYVIGGLTAK